jgi:hypothetical protein
MEKLAFKSRVRKLKALGLTVSLDTGYRLSPRGESVLERIVRRSDQILHVVEETHLSGLSNIMDDDLVTLSREELISEVKRLRAGIRAHRDSSGQDLCWHHPQLWGLLPEPVMPDVAVPPWPKFLRGCVRYREALERELPHAPVADVESDESHNRVVNDAFGADGETT